MYKRFVVINSPGIGVGNIRNTSSNDHSLEKLLKCAYKKDLKPNLSGLETLGLEAFVKYSGTVARKVSSTALLASKKIHGTDDFSAYIEMGGGDQNSLPIWGRLNDVNIVSIANEETILPSDEFIEAKSDVESATQLLECMNSPLVRNELIIVTLNDYREAALENNPTFAIACLSQFSIMINEAIKLLGNVDALLALSSTAIDASREVEDMGENEFRNELLPMFFYTPTGKTHNLGLRLLCDVGPSIAEFFGIERSKLIGASMGKWFFDDSNPQLEEESSLHS